LNGNQLDQIASEILWEWELWVGTAMKLWSVSTEELLFLSL
jgi:hypothetical protein